MSPTDEINVTNRPTRETALLLNREVPRAKVDYPNSYVIQLFAFFNQDVITLYIPVKDPDRVHVDGRVHQLSHDVLMETQAGTSM